MENIQRKTIIIDAENKALGRLAVEVAVLLRGKSKPDYVPYKDAGDTVVVKNIDKMKFTGKKLNQKIYFRNTGYPGGIRTEKAGDLMKNNPAKVLLVAVRLMLPDVKFRSKMLKRLIIE